MCDSADADVDNAGLIPRALRDLFAKTSQLGGEDNRQHCRLCMSYVEIYNERLHDLLQPYKPNARLDPQVMLQPKSRQHDFKCLLQLVNLVL